VTSDDLPTRLPATVDVDIADPSRTAITPMPVAVNTVRFARDGSWLLLPMSSG
jgi:hypothetical protein